MTKVKEKLQEAWKAVLAFLIPALFGVAVGVFDALSDWLATQNGTWVLIAIGVVDAVAVWFKANKPPVA